MLDFKNIKIFLSNTKDFIQSHSSNKLLMNFLSINWIIPLFSNYIFFNFLPLNKFSLLFTLNVLFRSATPRQRMALSSGTTFISLIFILFFSRSKNKVNSMESFIITSLKNFAFNLSNIRLKFNRKFLIYPKKRWSSDLRFS